MLKCEVRINGKFTYRYHEDIQASPPETPDEIMRDAISYESDDRFMGETSPWEVSCSLREVLFLLPPE